MSNIEIIKSVDAFTSSTVFEHFKSIIVPNLEHFDSDDVYYNKFNEDVNGPEFHIRLGSWNRIFWNAEMKSKLEKRFENLNSIIEEFKFEITDLSDWDEEPGERTWPARINFKISKK